MKDIIEVHTATIIINNYEIGMCPKLENCFRIYDMQTHSYYFLGLRYDQETKKLFLPRGIDLWWIQNSFPNHKTEFIDYEEYSEFESDIKMKYMPRDDRQRECLRFMLGMHEYSANKNYSQLMVALNTGVGKTFTAVYTMAFEKIKSIVITYSNGWLNQWKNCIVEYTNMDKNRIHQIKGAESINMLLSEKSKYQKCDIFLVTHSTLKSYGDTYGWDKITRLFKLLKIGMTFIDEAHLNFSNICDISSYTDVYRTYYITATPARSNEWENKIYQLSMKNIPKIELFDKEKDPHTDYIAIKWNSKPTPQQVSSCKNVYGLDRNKYANYVVTQPEFYKMLHIILNIAIKHNGRCLFYIGTNDAIIKVYNWISKNYPEYIGDVGIYTTLTAEDKQLEKNKKILLSTTKSAGAAEDIKNLKMTVVLAEPFKSEILARQSLGRTRNEDTLYIELVDLAFVHIKRYYYHKIPIFNKYAKSVSDINMNSYELDNKYEKIMGKRDRILKCSPIYAIDDRFMDKKQAVSFEYERNKDAVYFFNTP